MDSDIIDDASELAAESKVIILESKLIFTLNTCNQDDDFMKFSILWEDS